MSSPHAYLSLSGAEDPYSAKSLLGPMAYETPMGASAASATAAAAAAALAKGKRHQESEGLWHDAHMFEEVPRLDRWESMAHHLHDRQKSSSQQGTSRVNSSLSASAIIRLMDRIAPWQVPKESATIIATQLDRMVRAEGCLLLVMVMVLLVVMMVLLVKVMVMVMVLVMVTVMVMMGTVLAKGRLPIMCCY